MGDVDTDIVEECVRYYMDDDGKRCEYTQEELDELFGGPGFEEWYIDGHVHGGDGTGSGDAYQEFVGETEGLLTYYKDKTLVELCEVEEEFLKDISRLNELILYLNYYPAMLPTGDRRLGRPQLSENFMDIPFIVGLKETHNSNYRVCNRAVYDGISRSLYHEGVEYGPNLIVKELVFDPFIYSGTAIYQSYLKLKSLKHCGRAGIAEVQSLIILINDSQLKPLVAKYGLFDESDQPWAEFYLDETTNTVPKLINGAVNKQKYLAVLRFLMGDDSLASLVAIHQLQAVIQSILPNHTVSLNRDKTKLNIEDYDDTARAILKLHGYSYSTKYHITKDIRQAYELPNTEEVRQIIAELEHAPRLVKINDETILVWLSKYALDDERVVVGHTGVRGHIRKCKSGVVTTVRAHPRSTTRSKE